MAAVDAILQAQKQQYKPVEVNKDIGTHLDIGNLMICDVNLLDSEVLT